MLPASAFPKHIKQIIDLPHYPTLNRCAEKPTLVTIPKP
jgi:hypothetical protein